MKPAVKRSLIESALEDIVVAAITTSVLASWGNLPKGVGRMPGTHGRFPGSRFQGACAPAGLPRLPGACGFTKGRTIRRQRGVQPRHIAKPLQWLFRLQRQSCPAAPCSLSARHRLNRLEDPDHSTVAGSAVMKAPSVGPPFHIPIYSQTVAVIREPFVTNMIAMATLQSQSRATTKIDANRPRPPPVRARLAAKRPAWRGNAIHRAHAKKSTNRSSFCYTDQPKGSEPYVPRGNAPQLTRIFI